MLAKFFVLTVAAVAVVGLTACHTQPSRAPGHYETTTNTKSTNGANVKTTKETDVYYDANGRKREATTTKTTTDPKGLFNKKTTTTSTHD